MVTLPLNLQSWKTKRERKKQIISQFTKKGLLTMSSPCIFYFTNDIFRIQLLPRSATYTFPSASTHTSVGELSCALVPGPSRKPLLVPAKVLTIPPASL